MRNKKLVNTLLVVLLLFLGGCALHRDKNPHNNVLVFGTTTKFALDVAAPVQNASIPEFTLGYKRLEAVWMPLKPNNEINSSKKNEISKLIGNLNECMSGLSDIGLDKSQLANFCLTSILPADKYVSISSGVDSQKGGSSIEIDTYSVFASLGAKGALSFSNASGNLAQFFATGVAAQRLGANPAVGFALNAEAPEAVLSIESKNNKLQEVREKGIEQGAALADKSDKILAKFKGNKVDELKEPDWGNFKKSDSLSDGLKKQIDTISTYPQLKAYLNGMSARGKEDDINQILKASGVQ